MDEYFISKLDNFIDKNAYLESAVLRYFLNPAEQYEVEAYLKKRYSDTYYTFFGGYKSAERCMLILNPVDISIAAIKIKGSGFHTLNHKDFLGAVLALGIERWSIGDIVVRDNGAIIFTTEKIHEFLLSDDKPLEYIGKDKVSVTDYILPDDFVSDKNFIDINGIISSARLDSIVAVFAKTSREKAKSLIMSGNVQLNFKFNYNNDTQVNPNDIMSIKGYGRYKIIDLSNKTRKDKIKLYALKYI